MSKGADFNRFLTELRGGLVLLNLAQTQEDIINAVQDAGKSGEMTIKLKYAPVGSGNKEIHVTATVTHKKPLAPGLDERSIFYAQRGQLLRNDPNQGQLYGGPRATERADGSSPAEQGRTGTHD